MDLEKATRAALKYLEELHSFFGDWTTALAAYNCGEFRIQRQISAQRINYLDNFWDLFTMLPRETARFVPRFIATVLIIKNPEKYGFDLPEPNPPLKFETIQINRPVKLSSLSQKSGLSASTLAELNPELRYDATPEGSYVLKVPPGLGEQTMAAVDSLSRWIPPEATYVIHYVRRGETVSHIAERYRTSTSTIARLNNLNSRYLIRPGQRLKVPSQGGTSAAPPPSFELTKDGEKLVYVVKRGDSLYQIARSFNTSVDSIKQLNNLRSNIIKVGQKLEISSGDTAGTTQYTVVAGDTPFKIAQQFNMSLNTLLTLNGLNSRSRIYPGQKLWVTK
jgi:membrane-bound lytic murein transglycosylase D